MKLKIRRIHPVQALIQHLQLVNKIHYHHLLLVSVGPAYTLSGRPEEKARSLSPGPGAYATEKNTSGGGPAFSLSGRPNEKSTIQTPDSVGPGAYQPNPQASAPQGPSYSMAARTSKKDSHDIVPGKATFEFSA